MSKSDEILEVLRNASLNEGVLKDALSRLWADVEQEGKEQSGVEFVKKMIKDGYDKEQVWATLTAYGMPVGEVSRIFKRAGVEISFDGRK
jgi:hypothetical protein